MSESTQEQTRKRRRWDQPAQDETTTQTNGSTGIVSAASTVPTTSAIPSPLGPPAPPPPKRRSRWDETPGPLVAMTPAHMALTNTPLINSNVPIGGLVPMGAATPIGTPAMVMATPVPGHMIPMTPEVVQALRQEREIDERNRPLSDEELDSIFFNTLGDRAKDYKIVTPPEDYKPIRTPARKLLPTATPLAIAGAGASLMTPAPAGGFFVQPDEAYTTSSQKIPNLEPKDLPPMKPEDLQYFDKLLTEVDEKELSAEEQRDRKIMRLLFKIKNGSPMMRKAALRQITDKAREFGAEPLFKQILPLLMSPALEDQERHLMVKVIDRIMYKLDDLVRPYVKKILVVIEPLLIDEDYYARVEGREIISNLAKAAGLATMISTMRPDIDNIDEYVRNTTARAFAVVASALGISSLLPFLEAVCRSRKSWQARHTGIKIIQQIAFLMGCAVLPYTASLVKTIAHGLNDEQQKVKTMTALAIAALAESSAPYGIESFDIIIRPLFDGIKVLHGKPLAAFLKAVGHLITLMEPEDSDFYTRQIEKILLREFASPDEEMKKIVLKVVKQCCSKDGVEPKYIKEKILPDFFKHFWTPKMAMDKRNYRQLVDTTVEIANRVGAGEIVVMIVNDLVSKNEQHRNMAMETIEKVLTNLGASEIDERLEKKLMDGIIYAFQEQTADDHVMLSGFGAVVNALGKRITPYLPEIKGVIEFRLGNAAAKIRQQAADFMSRVAAVMKDCDREDMLKEMGKRFYENLGEEYPEVLGSILGALKAIVSVIGMEKMDPPIRDLLPRLTPILKNRHEKVQENCIDLVGRIADRGAEYVSAREWMRICFELLELLKAHKKAIRRATVNTFGYIAKAIGTHDVLATLLNNLRVQERQNRVCTTVAIAIVAETCGTFAVLAALMNEYRVPELNVQNGVLKSLSFLFQYIGEMGKDYIYAVTPLLEDALVDRDLVHRQTALSAIQHMALGVFGYGCEDALTHLLNYVWPNIFETSPHLVQAFMGTVEALRLALGPMRLLQYVLQGLFHPARKVRDVYWRVYNTLYIGSQDALVAAYPRLPDDEDTTYARHELDYVF